MKRKAKYRVGQVVMDVNYGLLKLTKRAGPDNWRASSFADGDDGRVVDEQYLRPLTEKERGGK